jgi:CHAT domain-containing protein
LKRQEHLSDAEIEQCANNIPGACAEQIESHLSECELCLHRLLEQQRIQFKSIETDGMNRDPHPECYSDNEIQNVAAGMVKPEAAALILQHAAQCDHCGPLLNEYFEIFSEESSPEIEALIDQLPSSKPAWERKKASELAARMRPSPAPTPVMAWWRLVLRPRILATAGGLAALVIPMFIFGPGLLEAWQLKKEQKLVAVAYAKDRKMEMRLAIVLHGPMVIAGGTMGANDGAGFFGHPEFNKARSIADEKISSSGRKSPRWYQMKGELLLLEDPAKNTMAAEDAFREAKDKGLDDDPSLNIDLAISYFEQFTHSHPPSPGKASGASPRLLIQSTDLLNQVLDSPKATEEHKKAALFNLAIVYEKLERWDEAEATWDKYLKMDSAGPWADEARTRREEAAKHAHKATSRISFEPDFYVTHRSEPAVLDNTEEYLEKAVPWLSDAVEHPDGISAQAVAALADELNKHSDYLLHDLFTTIGVNDRPALLALGRALQANREDDVPEALDNARRAAELFARTHNIAGELWARFAEVYAYQRGQSGHDCGAAATRLRERLSKRVYPWLEGQLFLEKAICGNFTNSGKNTDITRDLENSESLARRFRFPILHLRTLGAAAGIGRQRSQNCDKANTWDLGLSGMKEYWNGVYPQERLFQFSSVLEQCAEDARYWNAAKALLESSIALRLSMNEKDRDWNMLVALYGHLAAILTSLGQQTPPKMQVTSAGAKPFAAITSIFLAERQLKMGKPEVALATLEAARTPIEQVDNDLVMVEFRRVVGKARLQSGQLPEAEQECQKGIEIAERYLSTLMNASQRVEWAIKTEELYRVLTQTWLQEKRIEDAWKLWEWSKARPIYAYGSLARPSVPKWPELQRDILALRVPSGPAIRLVFAVFSDRTHVWTVGRGRISSSWIESKQEDLNQSVDRFARNCADASSSIQELQEQGKALFTLLLQPFEKEFSAAPVLALEMDQQLWTLPISALRTPDNRYVAETYDVTYSPGILLEAELRMPKPVQPQSALLLINAWPQPTQEMRDIPRFFNKPFIISGTTTSKKEVLAAAALSNQMIFFGHAVAQGSGVALKLNDNLLLDAADFFPKKMPNLLLVVLAACSTGTSGQSSLLDNNTLVRTFLVAGVPHVVASQWNVDSVSTAQLMASFFQNSLGGQPPDLALTHAERTFLQSVRKERYQARDYLHPYYWAGFFVVGRVDSAGSVSNVASR